MPPLWDRGHNNIYFYNITADIVLIKYTPETVSSNISTNERKEAQCKLLSYDSVSTTTLSTAVARSIALQFTYIAWGHNFYRNPHLNPDWRLIDLAIAQKWGIPYLFCYIIINKGSVDLLNPNSIIKNAHSKYKHWCHWTTYAERPFS